MIKNNNRNSRDDKSKPGNRSTTGRSQSGTDNSYKGKSKFEGKDGNDKGKSGAGKDNYRPRAAKDGDDFKSRPPRDGERSSFKPRGGREGDNKDFKSRPPRDGERSSFKPREGRDTEGSFRPKSPRSAGGPSSFKPRAFKEGSSKEMPRNESRSYVKKDNFSSDGERPFRTFDKKSSTSRSTDSRPFRKRADGSPLLSGGKPFSKDRPAAAPVMRSRKESNSVDDGKIRLNRYIANSGICSRRKADELIAAGVVSVNGVPVSELGHKVDPSKDEVRYNGELLKREKRVYVLLNKPKDYITTTDDPQERRTVMSLVEKASRERIYPVGRLDRNTTGLLLMTNDGDLADKLSHPKNGITKIYHVELSKSLSQGDLNKIQFGLELEDGIIKPDSVSYVAGGSKREVGIQIHSGKNRIVRRIFEHLGYEVVKLDRVVYGNLTKKDLPRGRWRYLEEHELIQIKHLIQ
ncbi:pseudouridine synthase [Pedobacter sp. MC2016-15]|uniref:pseudouridine synthase n=1 Tax=Pedobacter sp. MC2016-15 TaxID=2994473 RepID=UPI002247B6EE|nr:pseudouridine synthase [Pedobacter sp. MC2016-15]MCX2478897.1 pseudouridine synthase [Pedobacter sp. MC2016-15]